MNATTMRHPMNEKPTVTCHIRHIYMPAGQTINEINMQHYILLNITIQSHSAKNGCFNQTKVCW